MTMTQRYAGMLRRHADEWDKQSISLVKGEAVRQAARHMEELQAKVDAGRRALDLLMGLHPQITIDDDQPLDIAQAIFDHVQGVQREMGKELATQQHTIELLQRLRARPAAENSSPARRAEEGGA